MPIPADLGVPQTDSVINLTQIATINRAAFEERLGALPDWLLTQVDAGPFLRGQAPAIEVASNQPAAGDQHRPPQHPAGATTGNPHRSGVGDRHRWDSSR